ncbi:MAG TPA: MFS transporter [Actinomycetota bacterium]|jgi:MFS family permease
MPASQPNLQPPPGRSVRLYGWREPAILTAAGLAVAAGFAQFGVTATLADVAKAFGQPGSGSSVTAQVGLSFTTLGLGLGVIRLAAVASLPLAGLADRLGRRRVLLGCTALGLAIAASAGLSPGYWWFVALFAASRPLLTATNAITGVIAAEETSSRDRAKAIALVAAAYGVGAGLTAIIRGVAGDSLSFRGLFALLLIPLAALPLLGRRLEEPDRFERARAGGDGARRVLGRVPAAYRRRLALLFTLAFAFAFVQGPANGLLFVYTESVLGLPRSATALMVAAAGVVGLGGLLAGRWASDRLGRRRTAGTTQVLVALAGMVTYSGTVAGAVGGYLTSIAAMSAFAPAVGALGAELFPTRVRGTVAGWFSVAGVLGAVCGLVTFGLLADGLQSFHAAAVLVAAPVAAAAPLFARLPETRGLELEQSAPDGAAQSPGSSSAR